MLNYLNFEWGWKPRMLPFIIKMVPMSTMMIRIPVFQSQCSYHTLLPFQSKVRVPELSVPDEPVRKCHLSITNL